MRVCVCVCIYTYIRLRAGCTGHTLGAVFVHMYVCVFKRVCKCVCVHLRALTFENFWTYHRHTLGETYVCVYVCVCARACVSVCVSVIVSVCVFICAR